MSKKEKAMKTQKEVEVMQIASVPSEEADGVGVVMATEIIADLKKTAGRGKRRGERLGGKLEYESRSGQSTVQTVRYY